MNICLLPSIATIANLLCLSDPSIITSSYRSYKHSSLLCCPSILFTKIELKPLGFGRNILPARDKNYPLFEEQIRIRIHIHIRKTEPKEIKSNKLQIYKALFTRAQISAKKSLSWSILKQMN